MILRSPQKSKRPNRQEIDGSTTLQAPVKGWNARDPEGNMPPGYALYLDNWFPMPGNVQVRKGAANWATGLGTAVKGLHAYSSRLGTAKLFATTDSGVYDATLSGAVGAVAIALTDGRTVGVNYGTTGGSYYLLVNGVDTMKQYDGTSWSSIAPLTISTGGTLVTSDISNLNVFKRQLFFLKNFTMEFYYLPIDSVTGTVSRFNLAALFSKGGALVAMGTWTIDGGQGVDDYAVFVTDQGQIALYKGTDPSSASTWALQGVYDLGTPLGKKCFLKLGGDLLYLSRDGVFPLSKALQSTTTVSTTAVTDNISNAFTLAATTYGANYGWQGITSVTDSLILFNIPVTAFSTSMQFVMNTKTGAWCRVTGWDAYCWAIMGNQLYMGQAGKVSKGWYGFNDFGGLITCYAKNSFEYLSTRAKNKKVQLIRPVLKITGSIAVNVALDMDYNNGLDYGGQVFNPASGALWDLALWDQGQWADQAVTRLDWVTVAAPSGYCAAPRLRVASKDATVEWSATDIAFEMGAIRG